MIFTHRIKFHLGEKKFPNFSVKSTLDCRKLKSFENTVTARNIQVVCRWEGKNFVHKIPKERDWEWK